MVTFKPLDSSMVAIEAAAIPLPNEDTTPPVTKINLVMMFASVGIRNFTVNGRGWQTLAQVLRVGKQAV